MANIPGAKDEKPRKIIYLGDDLSYWSNIQKRFVNQYNKMKWDFVKIYDKEADTYQETFLEILDSEAIICYIDFSTRTDTGPQTDIRRRIT